MAKNLTKAARNTSDKAQETSKDRFEKADTLLAEKEDKVTAKKTSTTKKKKVEVVEDVVVRCELKLLKSEEDLIETMKIRGAIQGIILNKSEIIRAGLKALNRQTDKQLKTTFSSVEKLKPGKK